MLIRLMIRGLLIGAIVSALCTLIFGVVGYYAFIVAMGVWLVWKLIKQLKES